MQRVGQSSSEVVRVGKSIARKQKVQRVGDYAKKVLPEMERGGIIAKLPVELTDAVFYPAAGRFRFCVVCGKHSKFRLDRHLKARHQVRKTDALYEVYEQVGRGLLDRLMGAAINLDSIPKPCTSGEWSIYSAFVQRLRDCGVPLLNERLFESPSGRRSAPRQRAGDGNVREAQRLPTGAGEAQDQGQGVVPVNQDEDERQEPPLIAGSAQEPGEGGVPVNQDEDRRPPTRRAPVIARHHLCHRVKVTEDREYRGALTPSNVFLEAPDKTLMFAYEFDDWREEDEEEPYYVQTFSVPPDSLRGSRWMSGADRELKLWRKLIRKQHPILESFSEYLKRITSVPILDGNEMRVYQETRHTCKSYANNVERFMLVAMRSRKRLGQTVSLDDAIYSCEIVEEFFNRQQVAHVAVGVRSLFAKSLLSFYKFLGMNMGPGAGKDRVDAVLQARILAKHEVDKLNTEKKALNTYSGLTAGRWEKELEYYCVVRLVVECKRISDKVEVIMQSFDRFGSIHHAEYNYVMSALMAYLVHCNGARNELTYKTRYGNVCPTGEGRSGLHSVKYDTALGSKQLWVGKYPQPKHYNVVRQPDSRSAGFFVVDKKSKKWLDHYVKLRAYVCRQRNVSNANTALKPFFIQWNGHRMTPENARYLMKQFFKVLGCGALEISSNLSRRSVARMEYERYINGKFRKLEGFADADIAAVQSHQQRTQEEIYVERFQKSCVYGYIKLKQYAKKEAKNSNAIIARLAEVRRMMEPSSSAVEAALSYLPESSDHDMSDASLDPSSDLGIVGHHGDVAEPVGSSGTVQVDTLAVLPSTSTGKSSRKRKRIGESAVKAATQQLSEGVSGDVEEDLESRSELRHKKVMKTLPSRSVRPSHSQLGEPESMSTPQTAGPNEGEGSVRVPPKIITIKRKTKRGQPPDIIRIPEEEVTKENFGAALPSTASDTTTGAVRTTVAAEQEVEVVKEQEQEVTIAEEERVRDDREEEQQQQQQQHLQEKVEEEAVQKQKSHRVQSKKQLESEEEEQEVLQVLQREADLEECFYRQMEILQRERYAAPLPEPAEPRNVVRYMQELNNKRYTEGLGKYKSEYEQQCFNLRRVAQPIQDFPWLQVRDIPNISGRGVFAKAKILKDQVVSDYRGTFVTLEERYELTKHMDPAELELVGDYEVEFRAYLTDEHGSRRERKYSILAHDPIYKGAVTIGRLFNHSKHANLTAVPLCRSYPTDQGDQMQFLVLFKATRDIDEGEQLLWDYGKYYGKTIGKVMKCLCKECNRTLVSSKNLLIEPNIPPRISAPDDVSYSQQIGMWPIGEKIDVRAVFTTRNVFYSLNVKTRVAGIIPTMDSSTFVDPRDAYRHSRLMFLGEEDGYPAPGRDSSVPQNANALLQLLCIAYKDAYERGNSVVLVLKREGRRGPLRRRAVGMKFVVLLGKKIEAVERKRYGNCIIYDDTQCVFQPVKEQTLETAEKSSMLQMFGEARLFYFPTAIEAMWTELRGNLALNMDQLLNVMDKFDPNKFERHFLQRKVGLKRKT